MMSRIGVKPVAFLSADADIDSSFVYYRGCCCHATEVVTVCSAKGSVRIHRHTVKVAAFCRKIDVSVVINYGGTDVSVKSCQFIQKETCMGVDRIEDCRAGIVFFSGTIIGAEYEIIAGRIGACPVKTAFVVIFPGTVLGLIAF